MDAAAYSRSRSKRPYFEQNPVEDNGLPYKRYQPFLAARTPPVLPKIQPGETVFRILCPEAKAGGVIGKGGSIISQMRQETGAKITVQEIVPGEEERVILISASEQHRDREDNTNNTNNGRDNKEFDGDFGKLSPAQEALLKVHSRIIEVGSSNGGVNEMEDPSRIITTRLVVPTSQVGCLLGKGGKIIEQMREETKAQIRILPRDQAPLSTLPADEILQIVGDVNVVKKALRIISTRLNDSPPRERALPAPQHSSMYSPDRRAPLQDVLLPQQNSLSHRLNLDGSMLGMRPSIGYGRSSGSTLGLLGSAHTPPEAGGSYVSDHGPSSSGEELVFRVLCPNKKIGSVIGRGGSIIKSLREEIGVKIKVTDSVPGSDDRIIIISSNEVPNDNLSPAQEALLHIQSQIVDLGPDKDGVITTRLLVPSNHVGCLIGKGGSIISEMRRATGANIRILPREDLPPCALETDELVQIVGDIRVAREALVQITSRLRGSLHRERPIAGHVMPSSLGSPAHLSTRGRLEPSPPGRPFSSAMGFRGDGRLSSSYQNLQSSPGRWSSKSKRDVSGSGGLSGFDELVHAGGSTGFGRPAGGLITKTTVEVVIPEHSIAALVGKSGNGIVQIRQISGAKVSLLEVRPGSSEGVVEISGTPEQTHAAQCLIEAAIINKQPLFA